MLEGWFASRVWPLAPASRPGHPWWWRLHRHRLAGGAVAAYFGWRPSERRGIAEEILRRVGLLIESSRSVGSNPAVDDSQEADRALRRRREGATIGVSAAKGLVGMDQLERMHGGLRHGMIAVNAEGSWLYNIDYKTHVVMPDGIGAFEDLDQLDCRSVRAKEVQECPQEQSSRSAARLIEMDCAEGPNVSVLTPWNAPLRLEGGCGIGTACFARIPWGGGRNCTLRRPRKALGWTIWYAC